MRHIMKFKNTIIIAGVVLGMTAGLAVAELGDESKLAAYPPAKKRVSFEKDLMPILKEKCIKCHGEEKQKSKYRCDSYDAFMKPGSSDEKVLIAGNSAKGTFIHYIARLVEDMEMPPKEKDALSKEEIGLFRAWVDQGARK